MVSLQTISRGMRYRPCLSPDINGGGRKEGRKSLLPERCPRPHFEVFINARRLALKVNNKVGGAGISKNDVGQSG